VSKLGLVYLIHTLALKWHAMTYKLLHLLTDMVFPESLFTYQLLSCGEHFQQQWFADEAK